MHIYYGALSLLTVGLPDRNQETNYQYFCGPAWIEMINVL